MPDLTTKIQHGVFLVGAPPSEGFITFFETKDLANTCVESLNRGADGERKYEVKPIGPDTKQVWVDPLMEAALGMIDRYRSLINGGDFNPPWDIEQEPEVKILRAALIYPDSAKLWDRLQQAVDIIRDYNSSADEEHNDLADLMERCKEFCIS